MKVSGGKSIYGASVGILMLDARFPRIPGDMGNAATWPFPVLYRVVRDATPDLVVRRGATGTLARQWQSFVSAHGQIANLFLLHRKHLTSADHRELRGDAYTAWREVSLLINA